MHLPLPSRGQAASGSMLDMHLFSTLRRLALRFAPARMSETKNGVALAPIVTRKASISLRLGDRAAASPGSEPEVSGDGVVSPSLAVIKVRRPGRLRGLKFAKPYSVLCACEL